MGAGNDVLVIHCCILPPELPPKFVSLKQPANIYYLVASLGRESAVAYLGGPALCSWEVAVKLSAGPRYLWA